MSHEDKPAGHTPAGRSAAGRRSTDYISSVGDPSALGQDGGASVEGSAPLIRWIEDSVGFLPEGGVTLDRAVTVVGVGRREQQIEVFDEENSLVKVYADQHLDWSADVDNLAVKPYSLKSAYADGSGVELEPYKFEVVEDLGRPHIRSVTAADGSVPYDGTTYAKQVTVSGTASAGEEIELFDRTTSLKKVRVSSEGDWSTDISNLGYRQHILVVVSTLKTPGSDLKSRAYVFKTSQR